MNKPIIPVTKFKDVLIAVPRFGFNLFSCSILVCTVFQLKIIDFYK
jgi:hypothetical protein